jgi:hypothetical protein
MIFGGLTRRGARPSVVQPRTRLGQGAEAKHQLGRHLQLGSQKEGPVLPQQHHANRIGFFEAGHRSFPFPHGAVPQFGQERPDWSLRAIASGTAQQGFPAELGPQENPEGDPQNEQVQEQPDKNSTKKRQSEGHSGSSGSTIM